KKKPSKLPRTRRGANVLWKGLRNRAKVLESALDDADSKDSSDDKIILYILSLYCAQHTEQGALYR
ncbi:hypothetical protein C1H46_009939, partial [Malus baccata]